MKNENGTNWVEIAENKIGVHGGVSATEVRELNSKAGLTAESLVERKQILLHCPHCGQKYDAVIGNNPLVCDGLTVTPVEGQALNPDTFAYEYMVLAVIGQSADDLTAESISAQTSLRLETVKQILTYLAWKKLIFEYNDGFKGTMYSSEFPRVIGSFEVGGPK